MSHSENVSRKSSQRFPAAPGASKGLPSCLQGCTHCSHSRRDWACEKDQRWGTIKPIKQSIYWPHCKISGFQKVHFYCCFFQPWSTCSSSQMIWWKWTEMVSLAGIALARYLDTWEKIISKRFLWKAFVSIVIPYSLRVYAVAPDDTVLAEEGDVGLFCSYPREINGEIYSTGHAYLNFVSNKCIPHWLIVINWFFDRSIDGWIDWLMSCYTVQPPRFQWRHQWYSIRLFHTSRGIRWNRTIICLAPNHCIGLVLW